mmetsp:Transcript_78462/g.230092  ORF Transcript_78462/g.230092 Transcript_78462/m.230092 type:complete len:250 (+) Transcript_78462:1114-1863(+)
MAVSRHACTRPPACASCRLELRTPTRGPGTPATAWARPCWWRSARRTATTRRPPGASPSRRPRRTRASPPSKGSCRTAPALGRAAPAASPRRSASARTASSGARWSSRAGSSGRYARPPPLARSRQALWTCCQSCALAAWARGGATSPPSATRPPGRGSPAGGWRSPRRRPARHWSSVTETSTTPTWLQTPAAEGPWLAWIWKLSTRPLARWGTPRAAWWPPGRRTASARCGTGGWTPSRASRFHSHSL